MQLRNRFEHRGAVGAFRPADGSWLILDADHNAIGCTPELGEPA